MRQQERARANCEEILRTTLRARRYWMREADIRQLALEAANVKGVEATIACLKDGIVRLGRPCYRKPLPTAD